jgi:hypothetical protein
VKTLLIYDTTGYIYVQITGSYRIPEGGLQFIETEIPESKILKSIDVSVTPNVALFEDIPKSETDLLKEQLLATQAQLADVQEQILLKNN